MRDDDDNDSIAGFDLAAWQPPHPPSGLADRVVARLRDTPQLVVPDRSHRRWLVLGGVLAALAAVIAIAMWGVVRAPRDGHGDVTATRPQRLDLDGTTVDLDTGAELHWRREGRYVTATQTRGVARWTVRGDDELAIDTGAIGASVTAHNASLRVEVEMNLSDARVIGASAVTAAVVAMVTVVVYEGHIKATNAGQTVEVAAGSTVEVRPGEVPHPPVDRPVVGAAPVDVERLQTELRAAQDQLRALQAARADTAQLRADCAELRTQRKWQDLEACATKLRPTDPTLAAEHAAIAASEQKAELAFTDLQNAVHAHDTKQIARDLAEIPDDSVYAAQAKALVPATPPVAALSATEVEKKLAGLRPRIAACSHADPSKLAMVLKVAPSGAIASADVTGGTAEVRACVRDIVEAERFRASPGGTYKLAVTVGTPNPCTSMDTTDVLQQAKGQFSSGYYATALTLFDKVLRCKPNDALTLRFAALAACRARNEQRARQLHAILPAQWQPGIQQACADSGIPLAP